MSADDPIPEESLLAWHAGRLKPAERDAVSDRLAGNPAARATLNEWRRQDAAILALYGAVAEEGVPDRFAALLQEAREAVQPVGVLGPRRSLLAVALFCAVAIGDVGWFVHDFLLPAGSDPAVAAARAYATYGEETSHPVEVPASEGDQLTAWVSKRLGHPLRPPDFATAGFSLLGGRVLPSADGPAALFLYQDGAGERLALYVAPKGEAAPSGMRWFDRSGTKGFWWLDADLCYAVAGNLPRDMLRRLATMAEAQLL